MTEKQKTYLIYAVLIILSLVAGYFGVKLPQPPWPEPAIEQVDTRGGVGGIRIGQDVVMGQDLNVAGNITQGGKRVMLTNTPGAIVLGTNTVTTTLTLSHGLTTPQTAFCTLLNDSEANGATCSATISGANVVIKLWKADGVTPGSVGKLISWMVGGQP